jgi:hypothetical protein
MKATVLPRRRNCGETVSKAATKRLRVNRGSRHPTPDARTIARPIVSAVGKTAATSSPSAAICRGAVWTPCPISTFSIRTGFLSGRRECGLLIERVHPARMTPS